MKTEKRALKGSFLFAAACCLSGLLLPAAHAQVLDQVPSDALVVLKVNHLQDTNTKVANFLQTLGVTDLVPTLKDPLGSAESQLGLGGGLDTKRDAAGVILNGTFDKGSPPPFVLLLPVSDYKAFLGTVTVVKTDGDVSVVHFKDNEDDAFVSNWGDYAAISDKKDNVMVKHEGIKPTGLSKKQLDEQDMAVYVNFPVLKTVLIPKIKEGQEQAADQISKQITDPAKLKVAQDGANQLFAMLSEFLNDAQGTTLGVSLSDAGITGNMIVELTPDSYLGKMFAQVKTTDKPLLAGLPKENYIFYGGSVQNPELAGKLIDDVISPVLKELGTLGDEGTKTADLVSLYRDMFGNVEGGTYGMVAPTAALGAGSLIRGIVIYKGDAAKIKADSLKAIDTQMEVMKAFNLPQADLMKNTVTPNFKTINGVQFDKFVSEVNPDNTSQQAMQASEMLSKLYGPDGATGLIGMVDPKTMLTTIGINAGTDDDLLSQTVDAVKNNTDVLTDGLKDVDANLPKMRAGVGYFGLAQLVSTGLSYAKAFGLNVGIQLPNNLPPIGFSVGVDGSAMRGDYFVSTKLLQSMVQAASTVYQQFNNHGGNGGGGGL